MSKRAMPNNGERIPLWFWIFVYPVLLVFGVIDLLFCDDIDDDDDDDDKPGQWG